MMVRAKLTDQCLWIKHVEPSELRDALKALPAGEAVSLSVDGKIVDFRKMAVGIDGRETSGLVPFGSRAAIWKNRYVPGEHQMISIEVVQVAG